MKVDLSKIPEGWFLHGMRHLHTDIRYAGQVHEPMNIIDHGYYPWRVQLQRYAGGLLTEGIGENPSEALARAVLAVEQRN